MKYTELRIEAKRNISEMIQAALLENGFDAMQIDDPMDAVDIAEHQELYKYDYIMKRSHKRRLKRRSIRMAL